ncbi:hypothetical protein D3C79_931760 [compost metagenome]
MGEVPDKLRRAAWETQHELRVTSVEILEQRICVVHIELQGFIDRQQQIEVSISSNEFKKGLIDHPYDDFELPRTKPISQVCCVEGNLLHAVDHPAQRNVETVSKLC